MRSVLEERTSRVNLLPMWYMPFALSGREGIDQKAVWNNLYFILYCERWRLTRSETQCSSVAARPLEGKRRYKRGEKTWSQIYNATMAERWEVSRFANSSWMDNRFFLFQYLDFRATQNISYSARRSERSRYEESLALKVNDGPQPGPINDRVVFSKAGRVYFQPSSGRKDGWVLTSRKKKEGQRPFDEESRSNLERPSWMCNINQSQASSLSSTTWWHEPQKRMARRSGMVGRVVITVSRWAIRSFARISHIHRFWSLSRTDISECRVCDRVWRQNTSSWAQSVTQTHIFSCVMHMWQFIKRTCVCSRIWALFESTCSSKATHSSHVSGVLYLSHNSILFTQSILIALLITFRHCWILRRVQDPVSLRKHDADQVWDVQRARHVHGDPDCPVRFGTHDGRVAHSAHLRKWHSASHHPSRGWPWSYGVSHEAPHWPRVLFHCLRREGDCSGFHWETVLHWCGLRHRAQKDWQGEDLRAPGRKHHCWRLTFPLRESVFQPSFTGKGASGIHVISSRRSATLTSATICTPMSCRQVARSRFKGQVSAWNAQKCCSSQISLVKEPPKFTAFFPDDVWRWCDCPRLPRSRPGSRPSPAERDNRPAPTLPRLWRTPSTSQPRPTCSRLDTPWEGHDFCRYLLPSPSCTTPRHHNILNTKPHGTNETNCRNTQL